MFHHRPLNLAATALAVALIVAGCAGSPSSGGDKLLIGAPLAVTGAAGSAGLDIKQGAELAISEINADGGVDGKDIELVAEDTAGDPAQAVQLVTSLARNQEISALLGPLLTPEVGAVIDLAESNKIPLVPPASLGEVPGVEDAKFNDWIFRLNQASYRVAGPEMTKVVELTKAEKVTIVTEDDNATYVDTAELWDEAAEAAGAEVETIGFPSNTTDVSSIVTKIDKDTDVIAIGSLPTTASSLVRSIRQAGIEAQLMGETSLISYEVFEGSRGANEGTWGYSTFAPGLTAGSEEFAEAFEAEYDREPSTFSALGYESIMIFARAARDGGASRDGIRKGLSALKDYEGVTGKFYYEGSGDALRETVPLVEVGEDGGITRIADIVPVGTE